MLKFLFGLFVLIFLFALPQPAEALYLEQQGQGDYKDYTFVINAFNNEPTPPTYIKDTTTIKTSITAWKDGKQQPIFTSGKSFRIRFDQPGGINCNRVLDLPTTWYTSGVNNNSNPNELNFSTEPKDPAAAVGVSCNLVPGTWNVTLWEYSDPSKPWTIFSGENGFAINSPTGGSSAKLVAVQEPNLICKDRVTEVRIENAEVGKIFNVYWKGDLGQYAWKGPAPERNFTIPLKGTEGRSGFAVGSKPELCLIEGNTNLVPAAQLTSPCTPLIFDFNADEGLCANNTNAKCSGSVQLIENNTAKKQVVITGTNFPASTQVRLDLLNKSTGNNMPKYNIPVTANGTVTYSTEELTAGDYAFYFYPQDGDTLICPIDNVNVKEGTETGNTPNAQQIDFKPTTCTGPEDENCARAAGDYCDAARTQLRTAIGCVPVDPATFIAGAMRYITGFSGGIALLLMIFGAFQMMTSGGNAETLKKGREQFVSAIIGLLFVIFAVLLLQIIGVDLLGLPGFKK